MDTTAEDRFDALYRRYSAPVYRYFRRRLVDADLAADAAADVFVIMWRRLAVVPEGDRQEPWVFATCLNVLRNHRRSLLRRKRLAAKLTEEAARIDVGRDTDASSNLMAALEQLRSTDREVLLLSAWEDLDHASIGRILGCSVHAVDQRKHRALTRLRKAIIRLEGSIA